MENHYTKTEESSEVRHEVRAPFGMIDRTTWDDPRFLSLSYSARVLLIYLKTCPAGAGITGIFTLRHQEVREHLGLSKKKTDEALRNLEDATWIRTEGRFVWVIDQMGSAPSISMKNPKHRVAAERALSLVPHLNLAREFRNYYGLNDGDGMGIPYPIGYPPSSSTSPSTSAIYVLKEKGIRSAGAKEGDKETEGQRLCDIADCFGRGVFSYDGGVLCDRHHTNPHAIPLPPPYPVAMTSRDNDVRIISREARRDG